MTVGGELSLHELVDLSLGTPEVVNYRGLRTLLLTIVDTLKLGDVKAQLKESEKDEILAGKDADSSGQLSRVGSHTGSNEMVLLEKKVSQLETKLDSLNQLPSNENLMDRVKSSESTPSPVSEMWQLMQVQKKAQSNEEGVSKLMSMVEHLMGEFHDLKNDVDGMKQQMEKFKNEISNLQQQMNELNQNNSSLMDRLKKLESSTANQDKINDLQKFMNDLNNQLSSLPPIELLVTWPAMEDALKGVYREPAPLTHTLMQTAPMTDTSKIQTMPTNHAYSQTKTPSPPPSRPGTAQSSRSSASAHPSQEIQKILKNIGELNGKHNLLEDRVNGLEELISKKADIADIERMMNENAIPEDLANMLAELKEGLEQLRDNREKLNKLQALLDANTNSSSASQNDLAKLKDYIDENLRQIYKQMERLSRGSREILEAMPDSLQSDLESQVQQDLSSLTRQVSGNFSSQLSEMSGRIGSLENLLDSKLNQLGKKLQKIKNFLLEDFKMNKRGGAPPAVEEADEDRNSPSPAINDSDVISGIRSKLLDLQAEVDKLNQTCIHMVDEHNAKQKHIDALYTFVDRLQENKADKEHVTMEIDVKADKRALENKISRNQFEGTVEEISRNLNSVMEKLSGHQSAWQQAVGEIKVDVENKLDRMELDPLKAYLDKRIKSVSAKVVRKEPDTGEDAAGFRKQLVQKYHCISCDRPLDMTPQAPLASLPESKGLPGTRSGRPYTTFELEQIRAAQKRCHPGKNINHYERALFEQEAARQRKQDIVAYLVHFEKAKKDLPLVRNCMSVGLPCLPVNRSLTVSNQYQDVPDYFVANRSCGGSHTLTYPHRRVTRITHLSNIVQAEDISQSLVNGKIETDVVGQDGHIYKARISPTQLDHLPTLAHPKSARARSALSSSRSKSQGGPPNTHEEPRSSLSPRPMSSRHPSRPHSSRPTSARPQSGRHSRSPPNATQAAGDGIIPSQAVVPEDQRSPSVITPPPSAIDEIAIDVPGNTQETVQTPS
ncbi:Glutamine-rich protein 2 [Holothuria leucospilota]|uniref:Glutamine-rich protein 2 n=1 Tax=Holothuria leucospilota TaxID=206669 RepID=A0A9Q1C2V3_HOLLE|nr:Glutamine-rich protein 2 [Holothuria leucospilota]